MNIAFVWTAFTSYMADCWRELSQRDGVRLKIWVCSHRGGVHRDGRSLMEGLSYESYTQEEVVGATLSKIESNLVKFSPDIVFICGWSSRLSRVAAESSCLRNTKKVLCCDMPWEWRFRKFAACFLLSRYLNRFDKIFVPGKRAWRYARWLGFGKSKIFTKEYCINQRRFRRIQLDVDFSSRGFVFVGRLVNEKNVSMLARAYNRYSKIVAAPLPLDIYGVGYAADYFKGIKGVSLHGYANPDELSQIYNKAKALVLPSRWEPWGQVVAEAMSCGCPAICSDKCGVSDIVSEGGIVVSHISEVSLACAFEKMHDIDEANWKCMSNSALNEVSEYNVVRWADIVLCESKAILCGE